MSTMITVDSGSKDLGSASLYYTDDFWVYDTKKCN